MKMNKALEIINSTHKSGFMVDFERIEDGILASDHFPDKHAGEELIKTENEAWILAVKFAEATKGKTCNIYVVDSNFKPVADYKDKYIKNR